MHLHPPVPKTPYLGVHGTGSSSDLRFEFIKLDHHLDGNNKDSIISAVSHWIVEIGELDSSFKKDVARLKGFITGTFDKVRRPYAHAEAEYQRRTVFLATVNDHNFLVDSTGNNRWWTIPVARLKFDHIVDMQQLYAQLAIDLAKGAEWWLNAEEEAQLDAQNIEHRSVSVIRDALLERLDTNVTDEARIPAYTALQLLSELGIQNATNPQCRECGSILREMFGEPSRIRGTTKWRVPLRPLSLVMNKPVSEDEF